MSKLSAKDILTVDTNLESLSRRKVLGGIGGLALASSIPFNVNAQQRTKVVLSIKEVSAISSI